VYKDPGHKVSSPGYDWWLFRRASVNPLSNPVQLRITHGMEGRPDLSLLRSCAISIVTVGTREFTTRHQGGEAAG
jgi:hypothetical protein